MGSATGEAFVPHATDGGATTAAGTRGNWLLPPRVVAQRLGVSRKTVQRLLRRGEFPGAQRVGARVRVPEADVLAYLERQRP